MIYRCLVTDKYYNTNFKLDTEEINYISPTGHPIYFDECPHFKQVIEENNKEREVLASE